MDNDYIEILKENFTDADLDNVTMEFTVRKQWLENNNIEHHNIVLYRWQNNRWDALSTIKISETASDVFYSSVSPGFSIFAIGEAGAETAVTIGTCSESWSCMDWSDCVDGMQTRVCTDENSCGTADNKPSESIDCEIDLPTLTGEDMGMTGVLVASVIVIVIVVIILFILKEKKVNLGFLKPQKKFKYKYKPKKE